MFRRISEGSQNFNIVVNVSLGRGVALLVDFGAGQYIVQEEF
jgi:hypothetical protein